MIATYWNQIYDSYIGKKVIPVFDLDSLQFDYLSPFLQRVVDGDFYGYKLGLIGQINEGSINFKCGGMRISTTNGFWNFFNLHISSNYRDEYGSIPYGISWINKMNLQQYSDVYDVSMKATETITNLALDILKTLDGELLKFVLMIAGELKDGSIDVVNELIHDMNWIICQTVASMNTIIDGANFVTNEIKKGEDKCRKRMKGLGKLKKIVCGLFPSVPAISKIPCSQPIPKIKERRRLSESIQSLSTLKENFESITNGLQETEQSIQMIGEYVLEMQHLRMIIAGLVAVIAAFIIVFICLGYYIYRLKNKVYNPYKKVSTVSSDEVEAGK